ncbi:sulfhydryl oxidase 2 isoform X2 [Physcomitrium patens]|uniref:Sulfhydryl oxidase n=1 Tax=Physcomitrium patens TaxID=3218 RepID=A0A7I4C7I3_PHYPA|nr:sulfhydryl oxidase 2-like isoform X2 [Physcomitrium patens]|eukprot:XP_024359786.1 sulfhydryl oxidase 2-like isoform X2 [Physcomitrella patens]
MAGESLRWWVGILLFVGAIVSTQSMQDECAVEIYEKIFKPALGQIKNPYVLVEFFASWSPPSKEFKPHYDRVACMFNEPDPVHANEVFVTKVDCALESNKMLCARFDIQSYPTLYWGPSEVVASGSAFSKEDSGLQSVSGSAVSTAEDLLQWINKRLNKKYSLTDAKPEPEIHKPILEMKQSPGVYGIWKNPATLHDVEEATAQAFSYMMDEKMMRSSSRGSFIQFMHLLERHHPSERCRKGSAKILQNLVEFWPLRQPPRSVLKKQQLCGPGLPRGFWDSCDGVGRGYSCGLWMLFHSLTVRVEDFEGSFALTAIEAFVDDFYKCDHCRNQFRNMTSRITHESTSTKKDVVLWLWRTHNKVTELVAREESRVKGHSPRKLWPPENECPPCRDIPNGDSEWDEEAVYYFLLEFYGLKGAELQYRYSKVVTSEKSVVVPYWAAVSIGLASLGCAMATCYSRVHKLKFKLAKGS